MSAAATAVIALLEQSTLEIDRAQAHLFALIPPHEHGEWSVDLEVPRFTETVGGTVHVTSDVQLVGTWSASDETWLWADHNPSVAAAGHRRLLEKLDQLDAFLPARSEPRFVIDRRRALDLATLCAVRTGWAGAWPGVTGTATAMLALLPVVHPTSDLEERSRQWCSFCGKTRREVRALVAGPGVNVCNECSDLFTEMAEHLGTGSELPGMPPCVFCGQRRRRVFAPNAAMCVECIGLAAGAVATSR